MKSREFNITGIIDQNLRKCTSFIKQVSLCSILARPCKYQASKEMCRLPDIRIDILKHISSEVQGIAFKNLRANPALESLEGNVTHVLQTPRAGSTLATSSV